MIRVPLCRSVPSSCLGDGVMRAGFPTECLGFHNSVVTLVYKNTKAQMLFTVTTIVSFDVCPYYQTAGKP